MSLTKVAEGDACAICVATIEYGPNNAVESMDPYDRDQYYANFAAASEGYVLFNGTGGDGSFSWTNCELCGALPGLRYPINYMHEDHPTHEEDGS